MGSPYIIRPGDTLYSLAHDHGVPMGVLATLNGIANPAQIRAGRSIVMPSMTSESDEAHAVRPESAILPLGAPPIDTRLRLARGQYFQERVKKDLIVLHFTAGTTAAGAFQSWQSTPVEVGTAYILDRDGTIYETRLSAGRIIWALRGRSPLGIGITSGPLGSRS